MSVPNSSSFRPQRFSRSRRFTPPGILCGRFASLPRARFLFRGIPHKAVEWTFIPSNPPVVGAMYRTSPSGCCRLVIRCIGSRVAVRNARSPLELFLLRVFLYTPLLRLRVLPLMTFTRRSSPSPCAGLQRFDRCVAFPPVSSDVFPFKILGLPTTLPLQARPDMCQAAHYDRLRCIKVHPTCQTRPPRYSRACWKRARRG